MSQIDIGLTVEDWDYTFRVLYAVRPVIHASWSGPEEGGVEVQSVFCVAAVQDGRQPLPQATLDAMRDSLVGLLHEHYSHQDVHAACVADHEERQAEAMEFWATARG